MIRRFFAVFHARNMEFLRDRSSLGWNIAVPLLLVFGLALIFAGPDRPLFKVAVVSVEQQAQPAAHPFLQTRFVDFIPVTDRESTLRKVARHRIDMLLDPRPPARYWINPESPKGYLLERVLAGSGGPPIERMTAQGDGVRYVDWVLPGVLGMNIMFSCLFGVGYVVVRYRKNGFLKRLHATPLRAVEFIAAQIVSRLLLILLITIGVYVATSYLVGFRMVGGYLNLLLVTTLGAVAMIALGLLVAARVTSEELASGLLNLLTWPMMLLSGVWFSMEGTHELLQLTANLMPLTHLLEAARAIMLDGATLGEVAGHVAALALMSVVFMGLGAVLFKWSPD